MQKNDPGIASPVRLSRKILKTQYTDEFGGYSKTWFQDGLEHVHDPILDDDKNDFGMDNLARLMGLDIEKLAE